MTSQTRVLSVAAILLLCGVVCSAQTNPNLEQGFKPYGTYDDSSFDSVSMTNHNLVMHIPLFDFPQRGALNAHLRLLYNGKAYVVKVNCTNSNNCVTWWAPSVPTSLRHLH